MACAMGVSMARCAGAGRARVDYRQFGARPDQIGLGAGEGKRRRIGGEDAAHQRFALLGKAGWPGFGRGVHG